MRAPSPALAVPACDWCGSPSPPGRHAHERVSVCPGCGVGVTEPPPSAAELDVAYGGWYRPPGGRFAGPGDALLRRLRSVLARRLDLIAPDGPVLDVGSGDGALLAALRARGRSADGVERSGGPGARFHDLAEVKGEWAAVVFWHSLEHLPEPAQALARASELLQPGGVLVLAAPNLQSVQARLFGRRWLALDLPRHVVHLSPDGVDEALGRLGLRVERTSSIRGGQAVFGWLHGLAGTVPGTADLYDAIRRPAARSSPVPRAQRIATLGLAATLLPAAAAGAAVEAALRRGGSLYVEARRG